MKKSVQPKLHTEKCTAPFVATQIPNANKHTKTERTFLHKKCMLVALIYEFVWQEHFTIFPFSLQGVCWGGVKAPLCKGGWQPQG